MGEKKDKSFISERILGRELTFQRACKYLLLSLLCGIVFGGAFFAVNYLAAKSVEKENSEAESRAQQNTAPQAGPEETGVQETHPEEKQKETEEETKASKNAESSEDESSISADGTESETAAETKTGKSSIGAAEGEPKTGEGEPREDETGEQETGSTEDTEKTGQEEEKQELSQEQKEQLREFLAGEKEDYVADASDLGKILMTQTQACSRIEKYMVKVICTISEVTWFESTVETQRQNSGIIMGVTDSEVLILTVKKAIVENGTYHVVFHNGTRQSAVVKQVADRDGWAMFAVPREGLGTEFAESLEAVTVAPLSEVVPGVPVISAGSPMGVDSSYGFGYLNYVGSVECIVDGSICCCYTESVSDPDSGTFLMSQNGELIGLALNQEADSAVGGSRFLIADSAGSMLESLKKGYSQAKLGITGMDISFDMKYKQIPEGMYVTDVEEDSPAYQAGLKRGDIIVMIGSREIRGLSDYCNFMRNLRPEETVTMTIKRESLHSEYKELELVLTAGTR